MTTVTTEPLQNRGGGGDFPGKRSDRRPKDRPQGPAQLPVKDRLTRWLHDFARQWQLQLMAWPGVIFIIIFSFIPMYGLVMAFQNYTVVDTFSTAQWVGWGNFIQIWQDPTFWQAVINTLAISGLKLLIEFPFTIIFALMIYQLAENTFKRLVQTISYMPHFLSWIVLGGMIVTWLSTKGLFNQVLNVIPSVHSTQNWLLEPDKYWLISALSDTWKESGWGTILYLAAMSSIDPTLYEAAKVDGAGRFRQIWSITLPGIRSMIGLQIMLWVSGILGSNLDQTMILINPQIQQTANVLNYYVWQIGLKLGNFSYATAVGLGVSVISVILLLLSNLATKKLNDNSSIL